MYWENKRFHEMRSTEYFTALEEGWEDGRRFLHEAVDMACRELDPPGPIFCEKMTKAMKRVRRGLFGMT